MLSRERIQRIKHSFQSSYMRNGIKDFKSQQPYLRALAEIYERKFNATNHWQYALKAFTLYSSAAFLSQTLLDHSFFDKAWKVIEQYLGPECNLNSDNFRLRVDELQAHLKNLRDDLKTRIAENEEEYTASSGAFSHMIDIWLPTINYSNKSMVEFAESIMQTATIMLKTPPPCSFVAVAIGSLGRGEATPFSDLEYLFLIEDSSQVEYFKRLAVTSYLVIGSLRETRLESMDIKELKGWFVDGRAAGFQIDGITKSSGNIPTGNFKAPDQFIATPDELISVYKQTLVDPSPESIRGDVTSMLRFTTSIYSYDGGEKLLKKFTTMRNKLDKCINQKRTQANLAMLSSDILKHKFSPEFCEYSGGFPLSVKKMLYRFPSLILLDLTVMLGQDGSDSWEIIKCWIAESDKFKSFPQSLYSALVYACFSRLRCYLLMGSASGVVESDRRLAATVSPYGDPKHVFIFERGKVATLSDKEFQSLCEAFLQLQSHVKSVSESSSTVEEVRRLLKSEVRRDFSCSVLAKFYSCKWLDVVQLVDENSLGLNEWDLLYAKARSLLELGMFTDALTIYQRLMGDQGYLGSNPLSNLDVLRGIARCLKGKGQLKDAELIYKKAFKLCKPDEDEGETVGRKDFAQLKMEYAISMMRLTSDKSTALDMLIDALGDLILDVALTHRKTASTSTDTTRLIEQFHCSTPDERLEFCCNPTREIAYCVFVISKIYEFAEEFNLYAKYFQKARALGLKVVMDKETDIFTKAFTMLDLGERCQAEEYLDKAMELQKQLPGSHRVKCLGLRILLSQCACGVTNKREHLEQLPEDKKLGVNPGVSSLQSEEDLYQKVERTTEMIKQVHVSEDHQDYGTLYKLKADIGKKTGADETTVLANYRMAREIFDKNSSKLEGATVRNAEAEILIGRKNFSKADSLLKEAQSIIEKAMGDHDVIEVADVLLKRSALLEQTGDAAQAQDLRTRAALIERQVATGKATFVNNVKEDLKKAESKEKEEKELDSFLQSIRQDLENVKPENRSDCFRKLKKYLLTMDLSKSAEDD